MMLQFGAKGHQVKWLQQQLLQQGTVIAVDGDYGEATRQAVLRYQLDNDLPPTGSVGPRMLARLAGKARPELLTLRDLQQAANTLEIALATMVALANVESRSNGFFDNGEAVILYERHIFYRQIAVTDQAQADVLAERYPNLCNPKPGGYIGGANEYSRLRAACSLDMDAAIEACSWGMFQIMGMHWQSLGYDSAIAMSRAMAASEAEQLNALVKFIMADSKLHQALQQRKWGEFAKRYNGPNYQANNYDIKLARSYQQLDVLLKEQGYE